MPRGASVVRYEGKRGAVWRIKYRDAAGKQVQETLGPEPPWTERKAQRELGKRLAAVDEGFRKPDARRHSPTSPQRFMREYLPGPEPQAVDRPRTTATSSTATSLPFFGDRALAETRGAARAHRRLRRPQGAERALAEDDPEPPPPAQRHAAPRRRLAADPHATRSRASTGRGSSSPR